jgi:hypothetical protein
MSIKPRQPADFELRYRVIFHFRYIAVLHAIEQELDQAFRSKHIIPSADWTLLDSGEHGGGGCWVTFEHDEPFDPKELERCCHNIELLDAACEAMVQFTKAQGV